MNDEQVKAIAKQLERARSKFWDISMNIVSLEAELKKLRKEEWEIEKVIKDLSDGLPDSGDTTNERN